MKSCAHGRRLLLVLSLLLAVGCNRVGVAPTGPSVLLVTIDTLRADHVGAYGATLGQTPVLDALAAEGTLFETALAPAPLTLPSHASILTGITPPRHGVRHNGIFRLEPAAETLAERFQAAGYDTGAFVGSVVLASGSGLAQGFAVYDANMSPRRASATGYPERTAGEVTDAALRWLAGRDRPFFLWVHYYDPHAAYEPPQPFAERFAESPYDGEIAYVDSEIARLRQALIQRGAWERTLLVVTSDHGESLGEHGEPTHAYTLYDAALRVPWILRGPRVPSGLRLAPVVSMIDLAPTVLALSGLPPLSRVDGRDLGPLLAGSALPATPAYAETLATRLDHGWAPLFSVRTERHLYVRAPRPELYDVVRDPQQLSNLLERDAEASAESVARLEAELDRVLAGEREGRRVALQEETRQQLRALGYLLPEVPPEATGLDPKDGLRLVAPFITARALYAEGRIQEAESLARRLLVALPESAELRDLLARIALTASRPRDAVAHAEAAVSRVPESASYRVLLGLTRAAAGAYAAAVDSFEAALALDPEEPEALTGLMWKAKLGASDAEVAGYAERALRLRPRSPTAWLGVAHTWDKLGRVDRALASYRRAAALDPDDGHAHLGIAVQLARMGRLSEFDEHVRLAGAVGRSVPGRMRLAIALAGRGEIPRAERLLRQMLAEHPELDDARRLLAVVLERTGRGEEARALGAR